MDYYKYNNETKSDLWINYDLWLNFIKIFTKIRSLKKVKQTNFSQPSAFS